MQLLRGIMYGIAFLAAAGAAGADEPLQPAAARPTPDLPYQAKRVDPVTYEIDFSVVVTAPYHTELLKVWLPLPQSDAAQDISTRRLSTFPQQIEPELHREPVFGNEFAYFEFHDPKGAQIIRHRFRAKVWELHWDLDPAQVAPVAEWPAAFEPYLRPQPSLADDEQFRALLAQLVPRSRGPAHDLADVLAWVDQNLTYDHQRASLAADAQFAFTARRGHCSDYHGLCATMGRALGQPTRVTYGLNLFPKNSPSHCKLEAFLPPYGWVSFDVSETQKLVARIAQDTSLSTEQRQQLAARARARLLRGFRDNTWLLLTRGTNYELAPPARDKVAVVRTIYAEADGKPLPDPDPANPAQRKFSWMTAHRYQPDRPVTYPFKDLSSLDSP